jgi:phage tail sheath protein FI
VAFLRPGVYVLEVPSGARAIEGVQTSTTIFVCEAERGPLGPTKIKGRVEYERLFGGYFRQRAPVGSPPVPVGPTRLLLPHALDGFFANGAAPRTSCAPWTAGTPRPPPNSA